MTTYIGFTDLDSVLFNFVQKYYGTRIDNDETVTISTLVYDDMHRSFDEANEILMGITHIKSVPLATQFSGNYPLHARKLQGYLMVYNTLLSAHYGEFDAEIPGWVRVYKTRAQEVEADIVSQRVVFENDYTQGETGLGVGTWVSRTGSANLYTNWEIGTYIFDDYPKTYRVEIDGTSSGHGIGTATFKWSDNNGASYATTAVKTGTQWKHLEYGLQVRWEAVGTGTQCVLGDNFSVTCVPKTYTPKGRAIRHITFRRG